MEVMASRSGKSWLVRSCWRIAVLLLVILAGAGLMRALRARGPIYQGRYTVDWVAQALRDKDRSEAFEAVLKIGAPSLPFIVRQGLQDKCHKFHSLSSDRVLSFAMAHPWLDRRLGISGRVENCVAKHHQAAWILCCLGTNAQAALPGVIDCLEHCPQQHFIHSQELLDTLGEISGTNRAAIPFLTRYSRDGCSLCLRAAAMAYEIDGRTNLLVETCNRLARTDPSQLLDGQELFWFREDHELNQHLVPFLERLCYQGHGSALFELQSRSNDASAAIARILARNSGLPAGEQ